MPSLHKFFAYVRCQLNIEAMCALDTGRYVKFIFAWNAIYSKI